MRRGLMGVAERKERDKLARRRDILHAARECFFTAGFESTTIQQIAGRVELSTGTIYLYFKSKEEIYVSILEEGLDIMLDLFRKAVRPGLSATDNLRNVIRAFMRFYRQYGEYLDIMAFMRLSSDRSSGIPAALRLSVQGQVEACYGVVEGVIQEGIDSGELRPVNTRGFARSLWGLLTGIVRSFESGAQGPLGGDLTESPPLEQVIELATRLMLDGARVDSGQPAASP